MIELFLHKVLSHVLTKPLLIVTPSIIIESLQPRTEALIGDYRKNQTITSPRFALNWANHVTSWTVNRVMVFCCRMTIAMERTKEQDKNPSVTWDLN